MLSDFCAKRFVQTGETNCVICVHKKYCMLLKFKLRNVTLYDEIANRTYKNCQSSHRDSLLAIYYNYLGTKPLLEQTCSIFMINC